METGGLLRLVIRRDIFWAEKNHKNWISIDVFPLPIGDAIRVWVLSVGQVFGNAGTVNISVTI